MAVGMDGWIDGWVTSLRAGESRALGRAITLIESGRADDRIRANELLAAVLPHTGRAVRIGLSGTPGVGKSTFIEALSLWLLSSGHRVAVLAVDPSSPITGGSILGDKTRMQRLAVASGAFIRPTPAGDAMGGVGNRTREASLLCEAAGYDVVIIETVGVGQSEHAVQAMVDTFVVLLAPGGGDDLQGVKRGIIELADVLVINKADDERLAEAHSTAAAYRSAGRLFRRPRWQPPVVLASARNETGLEDVWAAIQAHRDAWGTDLVELRQQRLERELWRVVASEAVVQLKAHPVVSGMVDEVSRAVAEGRLSPAAAAERLLRASRSL